jgi:hypothetical protein
VGSRPGGSAARLGAERAGASAGRLLAGKPGAFAIGDKMPAALDFPQDAIALHELIEAREELIAGFAISGRDKQGQG